MIALEREGIKPLSKLKYGDAFRLEAHGIVWKKCVGGYREITGGPIHACRPDQPVIVYAPVGRKS